LLKFGVLTIAAGKFKQYSNAIKSHVMHQKYSDILNIDFVAYISSQFS